MNKISLYWKFLKMLFNSLQSISWYIFRCLFTWNKIIWAKILGWHETKKNRNTRVKSQLLQTIFIRPAQQMDPRSRSRSIVKTVIKTLGLMEMVWLKLLTSYWYTRLAVLNYFYGVLQLKLWSRWVVSFEKYSSCSNPSSLTQTSNCIIRQMENKTVQRKTYCL